MGRFKIISCSGNPELAAKIATSAGTVLSKTTIKHFNDGECHVQVNENMRGCDVFVVQPTCAPTDQNIMELIFMTDALRRASAETINAVMPYYGYARQDRKDRPRVAISASVVARLIQSAGADRILAMDLHAPQIQGFFDIPVDHLFAAPVLADYFMMADIASDAHKITVVSPDAGGTERARKFAARINAPLAIIDKRRPEAGVCEVMNIIGDVKDRDCIMVDDLIDTAGTLVKGAEALKIAGASRVRACASHGVFSSNARQRIEDSCLEEVVVTDTIPNTSSRIDTKIHIVSVAAVLGRAVRAIHDGDSISSMFS